MNVHAKLMQTISSDFSTLVDEQYYDTGRKEIAKRRYISKIQEN